MAKKFADKYVKQQNYEQRRTYAFFMFSQSYKVTLFVVIKMLRRDNPSM